MSDTLASLHSLFQGSNLLLYLGEYFKITQVWLLVFSLIALLMGVRGGRTFYLNGVVLAWAIDVSELSFQA